MNTEENSADVTPTTQPNSNSDAPANGTPAAAPNEATTPSSPASGNVETPTPAAPAATTVPTPVPVPEAPVTPPTEPTAPAPSPTQAAPASDAAEVAQPAVAPETKTKTEPAPASTGPSIAIGSQRDAADRTLKPKAVAAAIENPIDLSEAEPVEHIELPPVISDAGLSDDVEAEIEAALGEVSMEDVVSAVETPSQAIESGTRCQAVVTKIHGDNVFVKIDNSTEGIATLHHFKEAPAEGATVELIVRGHNREDGLYELSVPGAAIGASDWDELNEGDVIEVKVTGTNTGGLEASVSAVKGFIPASQVDRFYVEDLSKYVDQKLTCLVMEVNPEKRKLVLSRRAILDRENEEKRKQLLAEIEPGQIREGTVTKLMDFGAFVDLGGAEGLIHISKLSWSRVKHPSDVLSEGELVKVKVEKVDLESNRISLSHRDTLEHPWEKIDDEFQVDQIVKGTITRIADFGAFVKIAHGVEGLVHISEISHKRVVKVSSVLSEGQELDVKILSIDTDAQKISLSHKATLAPPLKKDGGKQEEEAELPARDLAVKQRDEPLKGGTDRSSGGESVGLNW